MAGPEGIELNVGAAPWVRLAQAAISLLGLATILSSRTAPPWMLLALVALLAVHRGAVRTMRQDGAAARLTLHADGSATLRNAAGLFQTHRSAESWASRWISVVTLKELLSGATIRCLVCRSGNSSDDYRRLLVRLKLDNVRSPDDAGRSS